MMSHSHDTKTDVIEAFNSTSRYLDDLLNIDNLFFEGMVIQIFFKLQLNKANPTDTEATFLDLHFLISNGFVSFKIYDKRDDFDFDIVNSTFFFVFFVYFLKATFLVPPLMVFTFLSLFGLQECLVIWMTSMLVTKL